MNEQSPMGILLINTGTPDAPTPEAIRSYLENFMSDRMLFTAPQFIWKRVVKYAILPKRPHLTAPKYQQFWTSAGSPFMLCSRTQRDKVELAMRSRGVDCRVELAMRYGNPSIRCALENLRKAGCARVVVVPLFPQQARVTTGTCFAEVRRQLGELRKEGWQPEATFIPSFYEHPAYQEALVQSVRRAWKPRAGSRLLVSFHSTLLTDIKNGDPYLQQATETMEYIRKALGDVCEVHLAFQSRFDSRKWLGPFTEHVLDEWASEGVDDVAVVCPGFVSDCLETSIDIAQDARLKYLQHCKTANAQFTYIPALGTDNGLIEALVDTVLANAMRVLSMKI